MLCVDSQSVQRTLYDEVSLNAHERQSCDAQESCDVVNEETWIDEYLFRLHHESKSDQDKKLTR